MVDVAKAIATVEAGLETAHPGALTGNIAKTFKSGLDKAGIKCVDLVGYVVGLSYSPTGANSRSPFARRMGLRWSRE